MVNLDHFDALQQALEIVNDVVAFDGHGIVLYEDGKLGIPRTVWHFQCGPFYVGANHDRLLRILKETLERSRRDKKVLRKGVAFSRSLRLLIPLRHQGVLKGYMFVNRIDKKAEFSVADVNLLRAAMSLGIAAMHETEAADLLARLRLEFLHRRTALRGISNPQEVLKEYVTIKIIEAFTPDSNETQRHRPNEETVTSFGALADATKTGLYIVAHHSTEPKKQLSEMGGKRYNVRGNDIFCKVFHTGKPFFEEALVENRGLPGGVFQPRKLKMYAPIALGEGQCLGVIGLEKSTPNGYGRNEFHALILLAAHAARPLTTAIERSLANRREQDLDMVTEMFEDFERHHQWPGIMNILARQLSRLGYHRGVICRVDYDKQLVIGEKSWAEKSARATWERLKETTQRHFVRNRRDCQVCAVIEKKPQVIHDPVQDFATHRHALKLANLKPFAVIPIMNREGMVIRTLHVERKDFAPLDDAEIKNLQQICRLAASAGERLEERRMADIIKDWSHVLQQRFAHRTDILKEFVQFTVAKGLGRSCRVYSIDGNEQRGLCYDGPRLKFIKKFEGFPLRQGSERHLAALRREARLLVCIPNKRGAAGPSRGEFPVEYIWPVSQKRRLEKQGILEWVEVPMIVAGQLVAKAVFDKNYRHLPKRERGLRMFALRELRLLATLGRLTSIALERTELETSFLYPATVGASLAVFRHEIVNRLQVLYGSIKPAKGGNSPEADNLLKKIDRTMKRIDRLRRFFNKQLQEKGRRKVVTVFSEIKIACELLPKIKVNVDIPKAVRGIKVPGSQRPLCLILLQLLQNSQKFTGRRNGRITVTGRVGSSGQPHVVAVSDNGKGISQSFVREINNKSLSLTPRSKGVGLQCAKLIAASQNWTLRVRSRTKLTRFEILIPQ